jgi:hypothetical protein
MTKLKGNSMSLAERDIVINLLYVVWEGKTWVYTRTKWFTVNSKGEVFFSSYDGWDCVVARLCEEDLRDLPKDFFCWVSGLDDISSFYKIHTDIDKPFSA